MRPYVIGLTGGIGAGKSTVTEYLTRNADDVTMIFDCDFVVHRLYRNAIMLAWLEEKFGPLGDNPRATLAKRVAETPSILLELEKMFTPGLLMELRKFMTNSSFLPYVIIDAPLLFEMGMDEQCDTVMVIHCPESIRRQRVMNREGMTDAKLNLMLSRQLSEDERVRRADIVIDNSGSVDETYRQIDAAVESLKDAIDAHRGTVRG